MNLPRSAVPLVVSGGLLITATFSEAQSPVYGAESPQAAVAAVQQAAQKDDLAAALAYIAPAARRELAEEGVTGVLMVLAFSDPDDAMPGSKPLPKAELAKKRKDYKAATDQVRDVLKPHGLEGLIGKPALAEDTKRVLAAGLDKADTVVLVSSLFAAMDRIGPLLGMEKSDSKKVPFEIGPTTDYRVKGDKATAKSGKETIDFVRLDGRWYLTPPEPAPRK